MKPRIGLVTTVIDGRRGLGTALGARKFLPFLEKYRDEFDFTLIHQERVDDPIYTKYPELLIPHVPTPLAKQMAREAVFWTQHRFLKEKFDIVHYLNPRVWPTYLLTNSRRIAITAFEAGSMLDIYRPTLGARAFRFTNRYLHGRMNAIIATSDSGKREIVEHYHVSPKNVFVIPLGVDDTYTPIPVTPELEEKLEKKYGVRRPYILSVSRFDPHKNVLRTLEAYEQVRKTHPDIRLVLVGGAHTPWYSKLVQEKIVQLNATSNTVWKAPFVEDDDMPALYSAAEALSYPSLHEGFGLPVVEAMGCGTPVVAANTTSIPEIAGDAALLVDPENAEAIADALVRVLDDAALRADLRQRGIQQAKKFPWSNMADQIIDMYRELLLDNT